MTEPITNPRRCQTGPGTAPAVLGRKSWRSLLAAFALAMGLLPAAPSSADGAAVADGPGSAAEPSDPVAATVTGGVITASEVEGWRLYQRGQGKAGLRAQGPKTNAPDLGTELEAIAVQRHLADAAETRGLHRRADVRMALWWFEVSQLEVELRRALTARLVLPPGALDAEVERQGHRFDRPRRVKLRSLLVAVPEGADAETRDAARRRAEELRRKAISSGDFADVATRGSDSPSRHRGGLVGWIKAGQLDPSLESVAMALGAGDTSDVLGTPDGFVVLHCVEAEAATRADPEEVRSRLRRQLRRRALLDQLAELRRAAVAKARFDLESLAGDAQDATVIQIGDWNLTAEEVRALPAPSEDPRENLEAIVYRRRAAQLARSEELHRKPDVAARLLWGRRALLAAQETRARVKERFRPAEESELEDHFQRHRDRYRLPAAVRLGIIRRDAERADTRRTYSELRTLAERIRRGEIAFEDAARSHSQLPSAGRGGGTPWITPKQVAAFGPEVQRAFTDLAEGEIVGPIQQSEGLRGVSSLWILRHLGHRPARGLSFEEARGQVLNELGNEQVRAIQDRLLEEILDHLDLRRIDDAS
ncbi:MAG: peptidylprolyl isomerase [Acidobacteriota bacterium]